MEKQERKDMQDKIKAMRCMGSRDPYGNCYMQQRNLSIEFGNEEGQKMCCMPKDLKNVGLIACPYYQKTYNVNDLSLCGWIDEVADVLEELLKKEEQDSLKKRAKQLWQEFGDIPMNPETECIEISWRCFPAGTHREEIWHWFGEVFRVSVAEDLMFSEEGDVQ